MYGGVISVVDELLREVVFEFAESLAVKLVDLVDEVLAIVGVCCGKGGIFLECSQHEIVLLHCVVHFPDFHPLSLVEPFCVLFYDAYTSICLSSSRLSRLVITSFSDFSCIRFSTRSFLSISPYSLRRRR